MLVSEKKSLSKLNKKIIRCKKCPRLSSYIRNVAKEKVKRFNNERYWGKPLPGFGDINANLLLIGLAPAAHGEIELEECLLEIAQGIGLLEFFMNMDLHQKILV